MIMVLVLVVALLVAVLRGGSLRRLVGFPLHGPAVPIAVFALQSTVIYSGGAALVAVRYPAALVLPLSYLVLLAFVWANRHIPGVLLIGLGLLLNLAAIVANGGYMPITPEVLQSIGHGDHVAALQVGARVRSSKDIVLPKEQTHLWILSDIVPLPAPCPIPSAVSLGDIVIAAGVVTAVQLTLVGPAARKKPPRPAGDPDGGPGHGNVEEANRHVYPSIAPPDRGGARGPGVPEGPPGRPPGGGDRELRPLA